MLRAYVHILGDTVAFAVGVPLLLSILVYRYNTWIAKCPGCGDGMEERDVDSRGLLDLLMGVERAPNPVAREGDETFLFCASCGRSKRDARFSFWAYFLLWMCVAPFLWVGSVLVKFAR